MSLRTMRSLWLALWIAIANPALAAAGVPDAVSELAERAAAVAKKDGFPLTRADRLFPLEAVRRGQRGVGFTVFEADVPEPFGVEVLGVLEGMLGPGEDVILARLTGGRIEFTGVIAGMSGSPVYIDNRLVGAVAYRFGSFSKEPIAGITPIERMLPTFEKSPVARRSPVLSFDVSKVLADRGRAPRDPLASPFQPGPETSWSPGSSSGEAIATPVSASGLHPRALQRLSRSLSGGPLRVMAGAARASPSAGGPSRGPNGPDEAGRVPAAPILPGSPIAALLTTGDVNLSAIGTVTFVENDRVLAFGHPFVGEGPSAFPMATASILNTLASEAGSYKQGLAAREVGVISQDRLTAIAGRLGGPRAPLVPLQVTVIDGDQRRRTQVNIVDDPRWMPLLADTVISSAVLRRLGAEAGGTVTMKAGFQVGDRYLEVRDSYAAPAPLQVAGYAAQDASVLIALVSRNPLEPAPLSRIDVELEVEEAVRIYALETAVVRPRRVRPGQSLEITARLRPYRGRLQTRRLSIDLPSETSPGPLKLFVGGGLELDRRDVRAAGRPQPKDLDGLLGILSDRRPARALYARLYAPQEGLRWGTEVLDALPVSARSALLSQPELSAAPVPERLGPGLNTPLDGVVTGGIELEVEVVPLTPMNP